MTSVYRMSGGTQQFCALRGGWKDVRILVCCLVPCRVPCGFVQSLPLVRRAQNSIPSIHLKQFRLVLVATLLMLRRVQVCTTLKFSGQKSLKSGELFYNLNEKASSFCINVPPKFVKENNIPQPPTKLVLW